MRGNRVYNTVVDILFITWWWQVDNKEVHIGDRYVYTQVSDVWMT